jgi:hypothetical protein
MEWQPIETAPKCEWAPYASGPQILGRVVGDGWVAHRIVRWVCAKRSGKGAWRDAYGTWEPTEWMHFPE